MSAPPRGSAASVAEIFRNAVKRGKGLIDNTAKMANASGHPPMTEPVTLRDLKKLPQEQAVAILRLELKRTTQTDPLTGEKSVDTKTLELVTAYLQSQRENEG